MHKNCLIVFACVALGGCPRPPTGQQPPVDRNPSDWCGVVESIGLPDGMECQSSPGYYTLGLFGSTRKNENSFDYYLSGLSVRGFEPTITDGPTKKSRSYTATLKVDANGSLDLTTLPVGVANWFPKVRLAGTKATNVAVDVSLTGIKYHQFHNTLRALEDAIGAQVEGSEECSRLTTFWADLCAENVVASVEVTAATPLITIKSEDNSTLDIEGSVSSALGAEYKTAKTATDTATLESDKPLAVAVHWEKYSDTKRCRTDPAPKCKPAPVPPKDASCNGSRIKLPESRAYRITDKGFSGGGRHRTALLVSPPDSEVDTLPFDGSRGADRTVQGPAEIFICSKDTASDTGGCGWTCTGSGFDFTFTIPGGSVAGDGKAPLHITPL